MQTTLTSVSNPKWANEEKTVIDCEIKMSDFGDEVFPFSATSYDPEEHGRKIFSDLLAGVYGPIAEYVPPPSDDLPTPASGEIPVTVA